MIVKMALFAPSGTASTSTSRRGSLYGTLNLKGSQSRLSMYSRNSLDMLAVSGKLNLAYAKIELEEEKDRGDNMCLSCIKRLWTRLTTKIGKSFYIFVGWS